MVDWNKISEGLRNRHPLLRRLRRYVLGRLDGFEKTFGPLAATLTPEDDTATPF